MKVKWAKLSGNNGSLWDENNVFWIPKSACDSSINPMRHADQFADTHDFIFIPFRLFFLNLITNFTKEKAKQKFKKIFITKKLHTQVPNKIRTQSTEQTIEEVAPVSLLVDRGILRLSTEWITSRRGRMQW